MGSFNRQYLQPPFSAKMTVFLAMGSIAMILSLLSVVVATGLPQSDGDTASFYENYEELYGSNHLKVLENGREVQLYMDRYTGCGFVSKSQYGSGYFHINMKIPDNKDTHGVIPNFYLTSQEEPHDELDFEFYGNDTSPIIIQTNIFVHGVGNREQKLALWFDPRTDFHSYTILWNEWHVVFFIDGIPIREFKNISSLARPVGYPSQPMYVQATLWSALWAAAGRPIPWHLAPFISTYTGFSVYGCQAQDVSSRENKCLDTSFWWNEAGYRTLSAEQMRQLVMNQQRLVYDYCTNRVRHPIPPPECHFNV